MTKAMIMITIIMAIIMTIIITIITITVRKHMLTYGHGGGSLLWVGLPQALHLCHRLKIIMVISYFF